MSASSKPTLSEQHFLALSAMVHRLTGITIKPTRKIMLEGRLSKRLRELQLSDFESYIRHIENHSEEREAFVNSVTTNETYFYRTPRIWEYINETFLCQWFSQNKGKTLSVWSAASSTGEEAHTLGIVLQAFKDKHPGFNYQIVGSDIDSSVLRKADEGLYSGRSILRFRQDQAELFERYMTGNDNKGYRVLPDIKKNIRFEQLNLFDPGPVKTRFSLVLLRNVLIYFNKEDKEKLMSMIHARLNPPGVVIIGESESLNNMSTDFSTIVPTIYQRTQDNDMARAA